MFAWVSPTGLIRLWASCQVYNKVVRVELLPAFIEDNPTYLTLIVAYLPMNVWCTTINMLVQIYFIIVHKFFNDKENNSETTFQAFWQCWYEICSTETKPPVREARQESEGQISNNMSDSLINIPAQDSFSSSVNRWTQGERRLTDRIIGGNSDSVLHRH